MSNLTLTRLDEIHTPTQQLASTLTSIEYLLKTLLEVQTKQQESLERIAAATFDRGSGYGGVCLKVYETN